MQACAEEKRASQEFKGQRRTGLWKKPLLGMMMMMLLVLEAQKSKKSLSLGGQLKYPLNHRTCAL